jgi:molecular chaperone Hsp33
MNTTMSELHKFIFDGLPVRGALVRLTGSWQEVLQRRAANTQTGAYPAAVSELLGEMLAAGVLMQSNIKFNGTLVLQIMGDGPVKVAVAQVHSDFSLRATANVQGEVAYGTNGGARLSEMVNVLGQGRCAITLDPQDKQPGQQPYQGVVSLHGGQREKLEKISEVLEHYMLQSEQLDTRLILAADSQVAAGLLIQRMPLEGQANLGKSREDDMGLDESFNRIAIFAQSLKREELLGLDADTLLHRLFWEEKLLHFPAQTPKFACTCSRERVSGMLRNLGTAEVQSILAEQGTVEVGCDFCGAQYRFDSVDAAQVFTQAQDHPPAPAKIH